MLHAADPDAGPPHAAPLAATRWPCATCGADNAFTDSVCAVCGAAFLAALREAEAPLLVVPIVGDLLALSRAQRLGVAALLVLLVSGLTALVAVLTG